MATTLELIEDALREINVISETGSASPEQGSFALRRLNQMMALWAETKDIDLGWYSQAATSETNPIPEWAHLGVLTALAVTLAPKYGATVSAELAAVASSTVGSIQTKLIIEKKRGSDMSYLPVGSGHYGRGNSILTDS